MMRGILALVLGAATFTTHPAGAAHAVTAETYRAIGRGAFEATVSVDAPEGDEPSYVAAVGYLRYGAFSVPIAETLFELPSPIGAAAARLTSSGSASGLIVRWSIHLPDFWPLGRRLSRSRSTTM